MFKVNNEDTRTRHQCRSGVFIVDWGYVSHLFLVFLQENLSSLMFHGKNLYILAFDARIYIGNESFLKSQKTVRVSFLLQRLAWGCFKYFTSLCFFMTIKAEIESDTFNFIKPQLIKSLYVLVQMFFNVPLSGNVHLCFTRSY